MADEPPTATAGRSAGRACQFSRSGRIHAHTTPKGEEHEFLDEWINWITGTTDVEPSTATTLYELMVPR